MIKSFLFHQNNKKDGFIFSFMNEYYTKQYHGLQTLRQALERLISNFIQEVEF